MQEGAQHGAEDLRDRVASFYDRSVRDVYRYFHRATAGDRRLCEDLTQETFLACVHAAGRGEPDALSMPWLMGVARHKLIDHYRRNQREQHKLSLVWSAPTAAPDDPFAALTDAEALHALGRLSDMHRLVLVLRYVDDLAVSAVAKEIGRSVRATESLVARARQALDQTVTEGRRV